MYEVKYDGKTIYYPADEQLGLTGAVLEQKVGEAGTFTFNVPVTNPLNSQLSERKEVVILRDGKEYWRGDVREIKVDFFKNKEVFCVGDMGFLGEYVVDSHKITTTYDAYFRNLINQYNSTVNENKRFNVGTIALSGSNTFKYESMTLLELLREIAGSNYYVRIRRATNGSQLVRYVDIVNLISYGKNCNQDIEFGENMMDYVESSNTSWLLTAIKPEGAELETETIEGIRDKVDISSVNNGSKVLVNQTALERYGYIEKTISFSNTTNPSTLKTQAENYLKQNSQPRYVFDIKAVDLHDIYNVKDILDIGDTIHVEAKPFDVSQNVSVCELSTNLLDISENRLVLSSTVARRNYTDIISEIETELTNKIPSIVDIQTISKLQALELLKNNGDGKISYEFNERGEMIAQHIADNVDLSKATKDWVWNINGLGYRYRNSTTSEWNNLGVAITMDGKIVADFITTGTFSANRMRGGTLKLGGGYGNGSIEIYDSFGDLIGQWNKNGFIVYDGYISGSSIIGGTINGAKFTSESSKGGSTSISGGMLLIKNTNDAYLKVESKSNPQNYITIGANRWTFAREGEGKYKEIDPWDLVKDL